MNLWNAIRFRPDPDQKKRLGNGTDARIGEELVAAGIRRQDIVLGFQPAEVRPLTPIGVG